MMSNDHPFINLDVSSKMEQKLLLFGNDKLRRSTNTTSFSFFRRTRRYNVIILLTSGCRPTLHHADNDCAG